MILFRGTCNLVHLDEERTHKISLDLDDNAGVIELFLTITGIAPLQDASNDVDSACNAPLESLPTKLTDEDIQNYVCINKFYLTKYINR